MYVSIDMEVEGKCFVDVSMNTGLVSGLVHLFCLVATSYLICDTIFVARLPGDLFRGAVSPTVARNWIVHLFNILGPLPRVMKLCRICVIILKYTRLLLIAGNKW